MAVDPSSPMATVPVSAASLASTASLTTTALDSDPSLALALADFPSTAVVPFIAEQMPGIETFPPEGMTVLGESPARQKHPKRHRPPSSPSTSSLQYKEPQGLRGKDTC